MAKQEKVYFGLSDGFAEELFKCNELEKKGYKYVGTVKPHPESSYGYFLYEK